MIAPEDRLRGLLLRGQSGDPAAYRAFLSALGSHLRAYFRRRMARWPDEVEDLVQETLLAVHNQRHTYDASLPLTAWIHAIARYKLVDMLRRSGSRSLDTDSLDDVDELVAHSDEDARTARRDLARLLEQLPDKQRLPIVHVKLEGLSVEETAKLTGLSASAVKVGIHRGLKVLGRLIGGTR